MIPAQPNPNPAEPGIEALAAGWQALAKQLRFLELRGTAVPLEQSSSLRALIQRSAEAIRAIAAGQGDTYLATPQDSPARGGLRVLPSVAAARSEPLKPFEGLDQAPGRGYELCMTGSGVALPAQDVVRMLVLGKQLGVLKLRTARETFTLEMDRGQIAQMQTNVPLEGERLGEILVRRGVLDATRMEQIRERNHRGRTGEILLTGKHVSQQQLILALETQVHLMVGRLCREQAQNFSFWRGPLLSATPRLRIDLSELMLAPFQDGQAVLRDPEPSAG